MKAQADARSVRLPLALHVARPYAQAMPRGPERIVLRYFDCLGRAQPLRNALVDAGVTFDDRGLGRSLNSKAALRMAVSVLEGN